MNYAYFEFMKKKILITSALPYVNNVPHLGNIIGCVLSADVFARFCRSFGHETIYICGTDEHGTATETKALEEGVTPKEICDKYYEIHKNIYEWFSISFDSFGRTSTEEQKEITQELFKQLYNNGFIDEEKVEQLFCKECDKFLADRFVEGICPYCSFEDARGDQCDGCGRMLNAPELKSPKCKVCSSTPELKESEHLFIDLPKLNDMLNEWVEDRSKNWTTNAKTITKAWIKEGLKKRAISRDLKWGIPIPQDIKEHPEKGKIEFSKYKDKVFYVWFDAPIGYLSITKKFFCEKEQDTDKWKEWWLDNYSESNKEGVQLYQFMAKDNIPFHTIVFPATLLGAEIGLTNKYTKLFTISSTEYLNYEDTKFSKSRGIGLFADQAKDTGIPADVFRYYLLINRPEKADSAFSWTDLLEKNNNELVANVGNLVNRTITFMKKFFDNTVPEPKLEEKDKVFLKEIKEESEKLSTMLNEVEIKESLKQIMHISKLGNQYFQEKEPWKKMKDEPENAGTTMYVLAQLTKDLGILLEPYMPETSEKIFSLLGIEKKRWDELGKESVPAGTKTKDPEILFRKLEEKEIKSLMEKYGKKERQDSIDEDREEDSSKVFPLDLKVAKVLVAKVHDNSDKLLILQVDIGNEKRQIVAGLKAYYAPEELVGKQIVIVSNLKPAKLRGETSQGMLLAAEHDGKVIINEIPDAKPGDTLVPFGLNPSKKIITYDDFAKVTMKIKDKKISLNGTAIVTLEGKSAGCDMPDGSQIR
jgi:methionyl-tRNA synthetase